jgi:bla regulator protein blaR1
MNFIPDTILRAACWSLLHSLWQGLIFAVVAGVIMVLTKKATSTLRYNLLCGLMALFLVASGYTFYRELHLPLAAAPIANNVNTVTDIKETGVATPTVTAQPVTHAVQTGIDSLVQYFNTHASLVVVTWFIIFLARFVKVLSGLVYAQRIRHYQTGAAPAEWQQRLEQLLDRLQITRPVSLLESALIKIPAVVGFLKPVILVPVGMLAHISPQQVESILLHELAHIRRQDYLLNLIQHLVDTIFFFNPALIWVSSLIREERENCCDDVAIRETRSRKQLIAALVAFHEYKQSVRGYALSFAGKDNGVVSRVKRIVNKKNHSLSAGERALLMGGLMVLSAAFVTINSSRPVPLPHPTTRTTPLVSRKSATANRPKPAAVTVTTPTLQAPVVAHPAATPVTAAPVPVAAQKDTLPNPFQNASIDKLIECKEHGVTPEFVESFQKMGYTTISLDEAIQLVDHGVNTEFIRELGEKGYAHVSLEKAIQLRDHGVTIEFLNKIGELGFPNIPLEKAIELVDHGVTPDFIIAWKKKIGKLLELNDYIKLRDAGLNP